MYKLLIPAFVLVVTLRRSIVRTRIRSSTPTVSMIMRSMAVAASAADDEDDDDDVRRASVVAATRTTTLGVPSASVNTSPSAFSTDE
ncbi:hypothetical protein HK405_012291 [Cladochytrium tenue]|nr:hypothetical protein HK405_012291 [Cladochytrium tenue]